MKYRLFDWRAGNNIEQEVLDVVTENWGTIEKVEIPEEQKMSYSGTHFHYANIPNPHSLGLIIGGLTDIKSVMIRVPDGQEGTIYLDKKEWRFQQR